MDTLKRAKKELKERVVLPIVDSIKINTKSHHKGTNKNSNNFNILADLLRINFNELSQNENKINEQNSKSNHEMTVSHDDADNNEIQMHTSFNLVRVDKFKTEIYTDISYLIKLYGITNDGDKHESSNNNNLLSSYVNDVFNKILDIKSIKLSKKERIYEKIRGEFSPQLAVDIYAALVQILVLYETSSLSFYRWSEIFSSEADTILTLYAEYQFIDEPYISYAKWIAYTEINKLTVVNPNIFENILDNLICKHETRSKTKPAKKLKEKILKPFKNKTGLEKPQESAIYTLRLPATLDKEEANDSSEIISKTKQNEEVLTVFWNSAKDFKNSFLDFIHELHISSINENFNRNVEILEKNSILIKTLDKVHPNQIKDIDFESKVREALIDGNINNFFQNLNHQVLVQSDKNIDRMDELMHILRNVAEHIKNFNDKFGFIFNSCYNINIPELLFHAYDLHLVNIIHPVVSETFNIYQNTFRTHNSDNEEYFSKVFELYYEIKKFLKQSSDIYQVNNLKLLEFSQNWFLAEIDTWREASKIKILFRIKKSIEVDVLEPEFDNIAYSSSAVDTMQLLYSTKTFWESLELFEKKENLLEEIIFDLCCILNEYIEKFIERIKNSNEENCLKFPANIQLVTANHKYVWENFENLIRGFSSIVNCDEYVIQSHLKKTEASINDEICDYFAFEMRRFRPIIEQGMIENCTNGIVNDTLNCDIESLLARMKSDLSASNLQEISQILWNTILEAIIKIIHAGINGNMMQDFFSNLLMTFINVNQIFCSQDDLSIDSSFREKIEHIEYKLQCYGIETDQLIHQYYKDRYKMQKDSSSDNFTGFLTIFCYFIEDTLKIDILNARNLPVTELNKKCDSYVQVQIVPKQRFPNFQRFKTKIQYNTIFPLYDESLKISLTNEQINLKEAIICFTIKEKSIVASDACIAEAFLSFGDIPHIISNDKPKQTHLKLTKLQNDEIESLKAIHYRSQVGDVQAMEFLAKLHMLPKASLMMKQIYINIKDLNNVRKIPKD